MIVFEETIYEFKNPVQPGSTNNIAEWKVTGGKITDIVHIKPGCGCTANVEIDSVNNTIKAVYTETTVTAAGNNLKQEDLEKGLKSFSKHLDVYLNDGQPLHIQNGMTKKLNDNKSKIRIYFRGNVNVTMFKGKMDPTPKKIIN